MNYDSMYMVEDMMDSMASASGFSSLLSVAIYVFSALAIYTIAQRRGIKKTWMAWVPVLNAWILGSISDQYRYVVKGEVRNKRKSLLIVKILQLVFSCAAFVRLIVLIVQGFMGAFDHVSETELIRQILSGLAFYIPVMILGLVALVLDAIALYDLYSSCDPANNVLYLVLSLIPAISSITRPLFLFLCRNQDGGMPPRREEAAAVAAEEPADYNYTEL